MVVRKTCGGVRITVNYNNLTRIKTQSELPIPGVDQILDSSGIGTRFLAFRTSAVVSPDNRPQGHSSAHVILHHHGSLRVGGYALGQQLIAGLVCEGDIRGYHGLGTSCDIPGRCDRVRFRLVDPRETIRALFELLRKHNLKLLPSKARLGATDADFLGHSILAAGVRLNAEKVSDLTLMPMPLGLKHLRSLLDGLSYYRNFLPDMAQRTRLNAALLKKGVKFLFTPTMEGIVREVLAEYAAPPVLVFPDWDAVDDGSRSLRVYCDASIDGFGGTLEREHPDGSLRPIAYVRCATLFSEKHWTPLDCEACSIVWAIKRLRVYLWGTKFIIFWDHKALEENGIVGTHNAQVRRWLEYLTAFDYTLEYRKGSANGNADFLSRLPQLLTAHDRSSFGRLTAIDDSPLYLVRACGLLPPSTSMPGVDLGRLVPRPDNPLITADFRDFRAHGAR